MVWKGALVAHFKALSSICLEGVGKTMQKLSEKLDPKLRFKLKDFLKMKEC
jgi:hypothetical protein